MAVATAIACAVSFLIVPVLIVLVRLVFGPAETGAVWMGSAISTVFFASTSLVGLVTWNRSDPRSAILATYGVKVSLLIFAGVVLAPLDLDGGAFVAGAVGSAISYLSVQVIALSGGRTRDEKDRTSGMV